MEEQPHDIVHKCLEGSRRVAQGKRHDEELVEIIVSPERCLVHISGVHAHLVIARAEIELREQLGTMQLIEVLVDNRDGKSVLHRYGVEGPLVYAETPGAVDLLDHQ